MANYAEFSFTSLWARVGGVADRAVVASGNAPGGVVVELPEAERAALAAQIAPFLEELEQLRLTTLATADHRARLMVPLAGGVAFLALLVTGQGLAAGLIIGLIAALVGWFVAMGNRAGTYQAAVKNRFAPVIARYLSGFDHIVEPQTDLSRLRDWNLFPDLQSARTLDQITGQRDSRSLSMSEMSIAYAPNLKRNMGDHTLTCSVIEVASLAQHNMLLVLSPNDAPPRLLEAQRKKSDLPTLKTGDLAFDTAYTLRSSDPDTTALLTRGLRSAILSLAGVMPASRPYLVFMPGYLAVLFPTNLADLAFHVPPYWVALDPEALLAQFASDLAVKNSLINAVLALPEPSPTP